MELENGDFFEAPNAEWIRHNLPSYEKIWQDFIGHDGNGTPLQLAGISTEKENRRKKFYQAHYSFAISAYRIDKLFLEAEKHIEPVIGIDKFWPYYDRFFLFMAYIGHIRDMFKIMDDSLSAGGNLYEDFQEFYNKRSCIIHGPRIPIKIDELSIEIPINWNDKELWESAEKSETIYLVEYMKNTRAALFSLITRKHPAVYDYALKYLGSKMETNTHQYGHLPSNMTSLQNLATTISSASTHTSPAPSGSMK